SIAGSREPLLAALAPAFIGRAREPAVACHGPAVAQVARQDLLDQHVRGLDANADHPHQNEEHQIWSSLWCLLQLFQARLFDLLGNELLALHIARQFGERVGRERLALWRAQMLQALRRLLERRIEAADAEPRQGRPDAADDAGVLANEVLALAVGPFGILLREGRDRGPLAVG